MSTENEMRIEDKLNEIQLNLKAKKSRHNKFGNYNYRSAEDILEAVKPHLKRLNCTIKVDERVITDGYANAEVKSVSRSIVKDFEPKDEGDEFGNDAHKEKAETIENSYPIIMIESKATLIDGSDEISATAIVGVDLNQKGMQTAQQFGTTSSYGKKYALGNLLLIDDTQDADATNTHGKTSTSRKPVQKSTGVPKKEPKKEPAKEEKKLPTFPKDKWKDALTYAKGGGEAAVSKITDKYRLTKRQLEELKEVSK